MSGHQGGSCPWLALRQIAELRKYLVLVVFANSATGSGHLGGAQGPLMAWCVCDGERGCMEYF